MFTFELLVNIVYMAQRAAKADTSSDLTTGMKIFFAVHGTLSLAMFIAGVVLYMLALLDDREQELDLRDARAGGAAAEAVLSELEKETGMSSSKPADVVAEPRFFERHKIGAYVFVFFWMVSFLTGEAIFYLRFGEQLFG
ncbi:MAG: hypothetical protein GY822_11525 [Deltaproteobacteria bacterium]|nr:hypothetical protein [Deltaproteobacteria bacterium]